MPRQSKNTVRLPLHVDQLASGRMVKTKTYSRKLQQVFANSNLNGTPIRDIEGWCNLNFTVHSVNREKGTVSLRYSIPNGYGQCCYTEWPIAGLSEGYGIRL